MSSAGALSNTGFLNNRIPSLVVTENHSGIHHVNKQLTEELQQPDCLTEGHTISNVFCLGGAQSHRLLLPAHPGYRGRFQRETALRSALVIFHTACPLNNPVVSYFRQCILIHERLCPEDISEDSWHQSSEAQPNMSSPC
jgi:hypothetical protein